MEKILNLQMSLFGSFINIEPDTDIAMRLLANLQGENLVPATVEVSVVDTAKKEINSETRLQMVSQDKSWNIVFLEERIDVNYNYNGGDSFYTDLNLIFDNAKNLLRKTFGLFSDTQGNRLALNAKFLLRDMKDDERRNFVNRFSIPLKMYRDSAITEWSQHINTPAKLAVSPDAEEECNSIIEMGDMVIIDQGVPSKRIVASLDINTLPVNQKLRFKYENLIYFAEGAKKLMETELSEIEDG